MPEPQEPTTLADEDIETRTLGSYAEADTSDTGDDTGDTTDTTDTGDDSGDDSDDSSS